jgi:hypothetical protein
MAMRSGGPQSFDSDIEQEILHHLSAMASSDTTVSGAVDTVQFEC